MSGLTTFCDPRCLLHTVPVTVHYMICHLQPNTYVSEREREREREESASHHSGLGESQVPGQLLRQLPVQAWDAPLVITILWWYDGVICGGTTARHGTMSLRTTARPNVWFGPASRARQPRAISCPMQIRPPAPGASASDVTWLRMRLPVRQVSIVHYSIVQYITLYDMIYYIIV